MDYENFLKNYLLYAQTDRIYSNYEIILINFDSDYQEYIELKKVCTELDMKITRMNCSHDIAAYPYLILILDTDLVTKNDLDILEYMVEFLDEKEISILFTKEVSFKLSYKIKRFIIMQPLLFNYDNLKLIILNKRNSHLRRSKANAIYDKKIFRMMYILLNLNYKSKRITTNDLCCEFNVSVKTIRRDIEMLRMLGNQIEFDKKTNDWKLNFSTYDFNIKYEIFDKTQNEGIDRNE